MESNKEHYTKWTDLEIQFLKDNYHNHSQQWCIDNLNKTKGAIGGMVIKLKLKSDKRHRKWVDPEIDFLKKNYIVKTNSECAIALNRTLQEVSKKLSKLNLRRIKKWSKSDEKKLIKLCNNKKQYHNKDIAKIIGFGVNSVSHKSRKLLLKRDVGNTKNVNMDIFDNITAPEVAYVLGFIWADGHVRKKSNTVCVNILKRDMDKIKKIFLKCGEWKWFNTLQGNKTQTCLFLTNKKFSNFLKENDYCNKSLCDPKKIIHKIPPNIQNYFIRGLVDGDGCFYINKKNYIRRFTLAGSYNQNWSAIIKIFNKLKIKHSHNKCNKFVKENNVFHKSSTIEINNKSSIVKLANYLYGNNFDFGLRRKFNKCMQILKSYK